MGIIFLDLNPSFEEKLEKISYYSQSSICESQSLFFFKTAQHDFFSPTFFDFLEIFDHSFKDL